MLFFFNIHIHSVTSVKQYKKVKSKRNGAAVHNYSQETKQMHGGSRDLGSSGFFQLSLLSNGFTRQGKLIHKMNQSHTAVSQFLSVSRKAVCL